MVPDRINAIADGIRVRQVTHPARGRTDAVQIVSAEPGGRWRVRGPRRPGRVCDRARRVRGDQRQASGRADRGLRRRSRLSRRPDRQRRGHGVRRAGPAGDRRHRGVRRRLSGLAAAGAPGHSARRARGGVPRARRQPRGPAVPRRPGLARGPGGATPAKRRHHAKRRSRAGRAVRRRRPDAVAGRPRLLVDELAGRARPGVRQARPGTV